MNHKYAILYTFQTESDNYGYGQMEIETDKKIETQEDLMEISRDIARRNSGVIKIAINKVTEVIE